MAGATRQAGRPEPSGERCSSDSETVLECRGSGRDQLRRYRQRHEAQQLGVRRVFGDVGLQRREVARAGHPGELGEIDGRYQRFVALTDLVEAVLGVDDKAVDEVGDGTGHLDVLPERGWWWLPVVVACSACA